MRGRARVSPGFALGATPHPGCRGPGGAQGAGGATPAPVPTLDPAPARRRVAPQPTARARSRRADCSLAPRGHCKDDRWTFKRSPVLKTSHLDPFCGRGAYGSFDSSRPVGSAGQYGWAPLLRHDRAGEEGSGGSSGPDPTPPGFRGRDDH